jgi:hypothetical protein
MNSPHLPFPKGYYPLIIHKIPVDTTFLMIFPVYPRIYNYSVLRFLSKIEKKRTVINFITLSSHFQAHLPELLEIPKKHALKSGNKLPTFKFPCRNYPLSETI